MTETEMRDLVKKQNELHFDALIRAEREVRRLKKQLERTTRREKNWRARYYKKCAILKEQNSPD